MSILPRTDRVRKGKILPLAYLEKRAFTVRGAIRYLTTHRPQHLSFACIVNRGGQQLHIPTSRTAAMKHLRRLRGRTDSVMMMELWGTVVVGG